ncbi:hypothetical protein RRG08_027141 [Elysia crispata]|uniref:Uncharacterized protein n=1 Tax=Elysia crispata TaxID=231223 RepID=A0AAE0YVR3_9GAST|nr:hypothetical protein RRG08_027141 [Elysia crispata]
MLCKRGRKWLAEGFSPLASLTRKLFVGFFFYWGVVPFSFFSTSSSGRTEMLVRSEPITLFAAETSLITESEPQIRGWYCVLFGRQGNKKSGPSIFLFF